MKDRFEFWLLIVATALAIVFFGVACAPDFVRSAGDVLPPGHT
jgi:hypothetical protein